MGDREGANQSGSAGSSTPRQEEATSSETLEDLEQTQDATKSGGASSGESSSAGTSTPSPDGAFDSPRGGRADGSDAGEPM
ncbi:MAG: hypothetical protein QOF61_1165 [Acidobacteriota bacterium]|jgi:hypothetical protein|nr:hypothetical protein [Acidobacteriota bacterium]